MKEEGTEGGRRWDGMEGEREGGNGRKGREGIRKVSVGHRGRVWTSQSLFTPCHSFCRSVSVYTQRSSRRVYQTETESCPEVASS